MSSSVLHFISPPIPYFVDCGRATYDVGDYHITRNCIGVFDLIMVSHGGLVIGENDKEWRLREGEALILRPDANHYGAAPCEEMTEIIWIHFQTFGSWREYSDMDDCLSNQSQLIASHKQNAYVNHCDVCSIFVPKQFSISQKGLEVLHHFFQLDEEPRTLRNWKRQATFQQFLQTLDLDLASMSDTTAIRLAEKIELFIRQNYSRPISNAMLQQELNYHPNYLAKSMLKVYGMTPLDYLLHYRIEQAKKLLIQTPWSISKIAEEVGFHHVTYFSSCFSKMEGLPPTNYRKKFIGHS